MLRSMRRLATVSALGAAAALAATSTNAAPLPPLPDLNAPPPAAAPQTPSSPAAPSPDRALNAIDHARRGVVAVESAQGFLGVGTVLAGDGRILTALSGLRGADDVTVRYADGSTARAKVGHRDKAWDLALLIPQSGRWLDGLLASEGDPAQAAVAFIGRGPKALSAMPITLKAKQDVTAKTGEPLAGALDFDLRGLSPLAGAPVLDTSGNVLGVFVLACKPQPPAPPAPGTNPWSPAPQQPNVCTPIAVGAPVAAIRSFLVHTPETAAAPAPWLGIRGESDASGPVHGVRVVAVAGGSPAEKGGLKASAEKAQDTAKAGDLIVAVDGVPVDTPEKLAQGIAKHAVGETVKLLVFNGAFRETQVTLRAAPPPSKAAANGN